VNRAGKFLLYLLLVQVGITIAIYRAEHNGAAGLAKVSLVEAGPYVIDEIDIEDSMGSSVILRKVGDLWLLPTLGDLPANPEMVAKALQQLTQEDPGWSVAHTLAARQRFQVAHYHFRRKVGLSSLKQNVGTVFLGTSPGFRRVHARNQAQDEIYSVGLNLYDLPARADKWLEPRLLQIRAPMQITADGYSLHRDSGVWQLGNGEKPDQRELQALLDTLRNLQVQGVASESVEQQVALVEADLILEVKGLSAKAQLQLFKLGQEHLISSSEYPYLFRVSAYDYDRLTGIDSFLLSGAQ
jgi:Domain of unknown function (DUF4340)